MNLLRPAALLLLVAATCLCGCDKIIENSRREQVYLEMQMFRQAILDYRLEYGVLPLAGPAGEIQSNRDLYAMLHAPAGPISGNPKGIGFIDAPSGSLTKGEFVDRWGIAYQVAIDHDGDGKVSPGGKPVDEPIAIWTSGPNHIDEYGYGDDYRTWR